MNTQKTGTMEMQFIQLILQLGRVVLLEGDLDEAKRHLLLAVGTPGSPQLNSFGPNMALARDLLEKGESEVVLQCFDLSERFWMQQFSKPFLEKWRNEIQQGECRIFEVNLLYHFG